MLVAYLKKNVAYGQDFVSTQFVIFCVPAVYIYIFIIIIMNMILYISSKQFPKWVADLL